MSKLAISVGLTVCAVFMLTADLMGATPDDEQVRASVERSLPYLEDKGVWWIDEKKCVTCHMTGMMTWSFNEAKRRGIEVDEKKLAEWNDWNVAKSLAKREEDDELVGSRNLEGISQLILGGLPATETQQKTLQELTTLIVAGQLENGSYKANGQLPGQKRPKTETAEVSTMWIALALAGATDDGAVKARERAVAWLQQAKPGKSIEWYAARLLIEKQFGDEKLVAKRLQELLALQNADGGWSWLKGADSDALATGEALYALRVVGVKIADPAIQRAREYLLTTQRDDGSWPVPSTKTVKKNSVEETSVYLGTAWATIGLLQTLPERK